MNITFTAHCVGRTFFGRGELGCFHSFDRRFKFDSYERAQVSSKIVATFRLVPVQQPVRLHSSAIVAPRKLHGVSNAQQVYSNRECRTQFCDIVRLPLLTGAQSISEELNSVVLYVGSSCTGVGCSERHPCFNPSCHCAIWQRCIATCFTQSLKTCLCTTSSCHFNFDPGTLL